MIPVKCADKILTYVLAVIFLFPATLDSSAQNKSELQRQRDELNKKIELTKKLISESEQQQKNTNGQMKVLNQQIAYREELLSTIGQEIHGIEGEISSKDLKIRQLEKQLQAMKEEYAKMIYQAYRNRSSYDRMMFIFAADDFNQAYKRFKIMQRYADARKHQVESIQEMQDEIRTNVNQLQQNKTEKEKLAAEKENERNKIAADKKQQQLKLTSLQAEEKKLRDQQNKHESDRKKLTARIEEIIRKEIEAANAAKAAKGTPSTSKGTTAIELAPEAKILNADFEKNKGGLPWPVISGVITSTFGRQPHPTIAGVEVNNNGIDFTTEKNAEVKAVFSGNVSSVFSIPGAGQNVIVTHGLYKTVYSGLSMVNVKVGDNVTAKQTIGNVIFDGEENTLHFELWKVTADGGVPQNPGLWIKKR